MMLNMKQSRFMSDSEAWLELVDLYIGINE